MSEPIDLPCYIRKFHGSQKKYAKLIGVHKQTVSDHCRSGRFIVWNGTVYKEHLKLADLPEIKDKL